MEEEVGSEEPAPSDLSDSFVDYGSTALGLDPGDPEATTKLEALKAAIVECVEQHQSGGYGGGSESGKPKTGGGEGLALIFGGGKK